MKQCVLFCRTLNVLPPAAKGTPMSEIETIVPVGQPRLVRLSDIYWKPWFAELLELAAHHGITTSDDADLWWDDFGDGKTPHESMDGFLASDEGADYRKTLPSLPNVQSGGTGQRKESN